MTQQPDQRKSQRELRETDNRRAMHPARHLGSTGRAGRGNGPLAASGGIKEPLCTGLCIQGSASSFLSVFQLLGDTAPASHLLTSMHFPADFPICLSSLVVKGLMGSSACSASALVTGSILSVRDE